MNRVILTIEQTLVARRGRPKSSFFACLGLLLTGMLVPAQAANILVVAGTDGYAQAAATVLNTDLAATNTVTVVNTGVPASLTGFTQIYDVRYDNAPALTAGEMTQYLAFLNAAPNNTVFLMGENPGFLPRNTAISQFIALAGGGTIAAPVTDSENAETLAAPFATTPNAISTVTYEDCGFVTTAGTGAFASSEAGGGCSLYFGPGTLANATGGALVVVYDVDFIASGTNGEGFNEIFFRQNLEHFVSAPSAVPPTPPAPTATGVPTLSEWAMILLACAMALLAAQKLLPHDPTGPDPS